MSHSSGARERARVRVRVTRVRVRGRHLVAQLRDEREGGGAVDRAFGVPEQHHLLLAALGQL